MKKLLAAFVLTLLALPAFGQVVGGSSNVSNAVGLLKPSKGGTGVANTDTKTITLGGPLVTSGAFTTTITSTGTTGITLPTTGTLGTLAGSEELTNKTLTSSVGKGTWTASGTWTLPALTLGGTVSGGGNQVNNVVIGTSTPLAGSFTTLNASGVLTAQNFDKASHSVVNGGGATTIFSTGASNARGFMLFVAGHNQGGNADSWTEIVQGVVGGAIGTPTGGGYFFSPPARAYSFSGGDVQVALSGGTAGTYTVDVVMIRYVW